MGILKVSKPFLKHNKMERIKMDHIRVLLRRAPLGDNTFSGFQKSRLKVRILKVSKPFLKHNKMERISNGPVDPNGFCFRRIRSGNKTFSSFQKGHLKVVILKMPVPLPTPIKCKVKTIGPLSGSALQSPSGG